VTQDAAAPDSSARAGATAQWHEQVRAAFAAAGRGTLVDRMGITLVEASAGRVVGTRVDSTGATPPGHSRERRDRRPRH